MLHLGQEAQPGRNADGSRFIARDRLMPHGDLDRDTPIAKLTKDWHNQETAWLGRVSPPVQSYPRWRKA